MPWWNWLIAAVVLVLVEMLTPGGFYFLFFGAGALVAGLLTLVGVDSLTIQTLTFAGVSVASLAFFRNPLLTRFQKGAGTEKVDSYIGETGTVKETVHPGEFGQAELRGSTWKIRNIGSVLILAGGRCIVEQVDGLTFNVRPAP